MSQIHNVQDHISAQQFDTVNHSPVQGADSAGQMAPAAATNKGFSVLPPDSSKFKQLAKYLEPPRTNFGKFCKGVERITKSWFKFDSAMVRAKEDFDSISLKIALNIQKCWRQTSITEDDKKTFSDLMKSLAVEAEILRLDPQSFTDRLNQNLNLAVKMSDTFEDFVSNARLYQNALSSIQPEFGKVFNELDTSGMLHSIAAKLTTNLGAELRRHQPVQNSTKPTETAPHPQVALAAKQDYVQSKKEIQQKIDTAVSSLEQAKVDLTSVKAMLEKATELSVADRINIRDALLDKMQETVGNSIVEAYGALQKKGVADAVRDVKALSTDELVKKMADMLNEISTPQKQVQDTDPATQKKLNFYEKSAVELKQQVQGYCNLFSDLISLLDIREAKLLTVLEHDYNDLFLPAKEFQPDTITRLVEYGYGVDDILNAKANYTNCLTQIEAMFANIPNADFEPTPEQQKAIADLTKDIKLFPPQHREHIENLQGVMQRHVNRRPLGIIDRFESAAPRDAAMPEAQLAEWKQHCSVAAEYMRAGTPQPISADTAKSLNYLLENKIHFDIGMEDVANFDGMAKYFLGDPAFNSSKTFMRGLEKRLTEAQAEKMRVVDETHQLLTDITGHLSKGLPETDPLAVAMRNVTALSTRIQSFGLKLFTEMEWSSVLDEEDFPSDLTYINSEADDETILDSEYRNLKQDFGRTLQELTTLILSKYPTRLSTQQDVEAADQVELLRTIPKMLDRINQSLPRAGVSKSYMIFVDNAVDRVATLAADLTSVDKKTADSVRAFFNARVNMDAAALRSSTNANLQVKLHDALSTLEEPLKSKISDEVRVLMHRLDSLVTMDVQSFKNQGLDAVNFLFENEYGIQGNRLPMAIGQSKVDGSVIIDVAHVFKDDRGWVKLEDELKNYLSDLSMKTEASRKRTLAKIEALNDAMTFSDIKFKADPSSKGDGLIAVDGSGHELTMSSSQVQRVVLQALERNVQRDRLRSYTFDDVTSTNLSSSSI